MKQGLIGAYHTKEAFASLLDLWKSGDIPQADKDEIIRIIKGDPEWVRLLSEWPADVSGQEKEFISAICGASGEA